jgi:aromatic-L-amino-acid decarboxylase
VTDRDSFIAPTDGRPSPLAIDHATFRKIGHALVDQLADALASVPTGPVARDETVDAVRASVTRGGALPEVGVDADALLRVTTAQLFSHSLFNAHPRFFGYITAPPAPVGVFGDFIASALNANVGSWRLSPAATEIEAETVRWIAEFIGFPSDAGGLLVSGGNMANFVCFFAARAARTPWDVRREGVSDAAGRRLACYASSETHTWIQKAADLSGLGTNAIRWIPTDGGLRMDAAALERAIDGDLAAGHVPFLVVGTAGTVSTGAVDPLIRISEICQTRGLWFHVDGAYGGFAAALPDASHDLRALSFADSVAVDPHKWLYAPLEAGCALVRDRSKLEGAFAYHPPYYRLDDYVNFVNFGMQNSRGFRALKVWLALQHAGAAGYRQMIATDITLAKRLAVAIACESDLDVITQNLSIVTFRYVPPALRASMGTAESERELNRVNEQLLDRIQRGGRAFVSNAVVGGRYVLRACIVNFHTTEADVDALPGIVLDAARSL